MLSFPVCLEHNFNEIVAVMIIIDDMYVRLAVVG